MKTLGAGGQKGGVTSEKGSPAGHLHGCDKFVRNRRYLTAGLYFKPHFIYLFNRLADCSTDSPFVLSYDEFPKPCYKVIDKKCFLPFKWKF